VAAAGVRLTSKTLSAPRIGEWLGWVFQATSREIDGRKRKINGYCFITKAGGDLP
jgi:hypothetical protein